jgi:hypothetical protein
MPTLDAEGAGKWELGVHFVGKTLMDSVCISSVRVSDSNLECAPWVALKREVNFLGRKMGGCLPGGRVRRCGSRLRGWPERGATLASAPWRMPLCSALSRVLSLADS